MSLLFYLHTSSTFFPHSSIASFHCSSFLTYFLLFFITALFILPPALTCHHESTSVNLTGHPAGTETSSHSAPLLGHVWDGQAFIKHQKFEIKKMMSVVSDISCLPSFLSLLFPTLFLDHPLPLFLSTVLFCLSSQSWVLYNIKKSYTCTHTSRKGGGRDGRTANSTTVLFLSLSL